MILVPGQVEVSHANFTEIPRVTKATSQTIRRNFEMNPNILFVEVDSVVMLTTRVTATSRMLTVLADTAMTVADLPAMLACLLESASHLG